jgi:hypothetical protein
VLGLWRNLGESIVVFELTQDQAATGSEIEPPDAIESRLRQARMEHLTSGADWVVYLDS